MLPINQILKRDIVYAYHEELSYLSYEISRWVSIQGEKIVFSDWEISDSICYPRKGRHFLTKKELFNYYKIIEEKT